MVTCPCCGNETDIPILFKGLRQYVFTYIWNNPNSTAREINRNVFDRGATVAIITAHLSQIRQKVGYHGYALVSREAPGKTKQGRRPFQYKIIRAQIKVKVKGSENALA